MDMIDHYATAQGLMHKAATAQDPSRLIGLAQAHLQSCQILMQVSQVAWNADSAERWDTAIKLEFTPDGKPVTK